MTYDVLSIQSGNCNGTKNSKKAMSSKKLKINKNKIGHNRQLLGDLRVAVGARTDRRMTDQRAAVSMKAKRRN